MKIKKVEVEYIESGTFVGGEEDCFNAGIERNEKYVVISEENLAKYELITEIIETDDTGDLDFIKYRIKKILN